jgi:L-alanine-DL-glutamate epimerase-like enolase superfamily enzyme
MADECVKSVLDARKVARESIADMINIKLMKSGGINDAVMINRLAAAADMCTMVGCMGEIQVSIAAGLHFALSSDNVLFADLDSHFNIVDDPSSGLEFSDGCLIAPKRSGLGVTTPLDG